MQRSAGERPRIHVIATQHLDVAWLWKRAPEGENLMKLCFMRSLEMSDADRTGSFSSARSTPWSFAAIERQFPELFERVKTAVGEGKIEPMGGQWVEPDNVIPSGESLLRQSLYGQLYYLDRFGRSTRVCWDPDVFSHGQALPQILSAGGFEAYYTHRCGPVDEKGDLIPVFFWKGPADTMILCFTMNWQAAPDTRTLLQAEASAEEQGLSTGYMITGANSDRRITMESEWLSKMEESREDGIDALWSTTEELLDSLLAESANIPVVSGDLGGFLFTGTYTSDQITKRWNRYLEEQLAHAEFLSCVAAIGGMPSHNNKLGDRRRDLCVNQFHDIICGTSYREVQEEGYELYKSIDSKVSRFITQIFGDFGSRMDVPVREGWQPILVANSHSFSRNDLISYFPEAEGCVYAVSDAFDNQLRVETGVTTAGSTVVSFLPEMPLPPMSINVFYIKRADADSSDLQDLSDRPFVLENSFLRAELDSITGDVISLYLKNPGYEFFSRRHAGNHIEVYEDTNDYSHGPDHRWDPWHISLSGKKFAPVGITSVAWKKDNSVRQTVVISRTMDLCPGMGPTVFEQEITLQKNSPVLEFHTYGTWSAAEAFLKAEFHLNLEADTHVCEMPYGVSERSNVPPVITGESRPEPDLPMQRWLDYSDDQIGLAFLNDGKYGYDIDGYRVRLSLMRAPLIRTGEIAGLGAFDFTYALYPHTGRWSDSDVVQNAQVLNRPLRALRILTGTESVREQRQTGWKIGYPLIELSSPDVHISAMKAVETEPGYIVRLWACTGKPQELSIGISFPITQVFLCNALEQNLEELRYESGSKSTIKLSFKPLEFKTLKLVFDTAIM